MSINEPFSALCANLKNEFNLKNNNANIKELLKQLKLIMVNAFIVIKSFASHSDFYTNMNYIAEEQRDALEIGVLFSLAQDNISEFECFISLLKPFYHEFRGRFKSNSPRMVCILGLELLNFLSQYRFAEFHSCLENSLTILKEDQGLSSFQTVLANPFISLPVAIERAIGEGRYNLIWDLRDKVPTSEYLFFIDKIFNILRDEIACSLEKSYNSLDLESVVSLLFIPNNTNILNEIIQKRGWSSVKENNGLNIITFKKSDICAGQGSNLSAIKTFMTLNPESIISNAFVYAKELEKIV